jgi:hypothetical protein
MIECFGVSSNVIAFVCIGSECAAVRTLLPLHGRIAASTALARAKNVAEASIARLAPPRSRRGITEQSELSLPLPRPEGVFDGHPKRLLRVDSPLQAESDGRGKAVSCGMEQPLPAVTQTGRAADLPSADFVVANRLFATLLLHQVRPGDRSAAVAKQPIGFSHNRNPGSASVPAPEAKSSFTLRSGRSMTATPAASPDPLPSSIETLFSELARRRLRRLAATERL